MIFVEFKNNKILTAILNSEKISSIELAVKGIKSPVALRMNESDQSVFSQVFVRRGYLYDLPEKVSFILDAGANIGLAALWFKRRYPTATIIAVEPDPQNYVYLQRNTAAYDDIHCVNAALWHKTDQLDLLYNDDTGKELGAWGVQVAKESEGGGANGRCAAYTVSDLLEKFGISHFDIAKIDIEGAEYELFKFGDLGWLDKTELVIAETHDRIKPESSAAVEAAMSGRRVGRRGENLFYFK